MIKARKKSIALITVLVFMLSVMLPMSAFAANDDYTNFSSTYVFATTGDGEQAGEVTVKEDGTNNVPTATAEVVLRLELPDGVEFSDDDNVVVTTKDGTALDTAVDVKKGSSYVDATYTVNLWQSEGFKLDFGDAAENNALDIDSDFTGDLKVKVTVTGIDNGGKITFTDWDDLVIAKVSGADINVKAADAKTVQMGTGSLAKITVEEAQAGLFETTDTVTFALVTKGVKFTSTPSTITQTRVTSEPSKVGAKTTDEKAVYKINEKSKGLPSSIEFTPNVSVDPTVKGEIKIRVTSDNNKLKSTTVVVGKVGDVAGEIEKVKDNDTVVYAGSRGTELDVSFKISPVGADDFDASKIVSLTLSAGKFTSDTHNDWTRYNSDKSIYMTVPNTGGIKVNSGDLVIKCDGDVEEGDIILTAGGNAGVEGEVVIGQFAKPFTVTADTPNILSEALNQAAGNIVITEVDAEALSVGQFVYFELPSGIELKGTPDVEVTEGNIDVDVTVIDKNIIALEIKGESSDASTIEISKIKYDTGRLALYGPVELEVYIAGVDGVMHTVANAIVDDQNTVTATFTVGDEGVAVVNGRTLVQVNLLRDVLGLQKSWDAASKTAYFAKDGKVVAFPMGENAIYINGVKLPIDQGGMIINDFTYATLRGLQLAFGGELDWDNDTKTATFVFNK